MKRLIAVVHISLDGFVADEDGDFSKLAQSPENLDFICSLTTNADTILAGRVSYEMLDSYWPTVHQSPVASASEAAYSHWYNSAAKIVLSNTLKGKGNENDNVTVLSENIEAGISRIKSKNGKDILLFGSPSVCRELIKFSLIDDFWIILYPVVLGHGIALFDGIQDTIELKCLDSTRFTMGEIAINYEVKY